MNRKKEKVTKINPRDNARLIVQSIKEVAKNSELSLERVVDIFQEAIEFVISRKIDPDAHIVIEADLENSNFKVFNTNGIVVEDTYFDELTNEEKINESISFILVSDVKKVDENARVDDIFSIELDLTAFEQWLFTAIMHTFKQKISEIVRNNVFNKYSLLKNQVVSATITNKISAGYIFEIDDDKVSAFMPSHYATGNNLKIGSRHEVVIENVTKNTKQSQVVVSSKSVQLVKKKIIDAIPELQSKYLEIASIARIPGEKCKVAIRKTNDAEANDISEIGSVVGETGSRIFAITQELDGEKIEVIKYDDNIIQFIVNAMSPSKVICVKEFKISHKLRRFTVVVPDFQHSLAIGKNGSNVKLTADLTRSQLQILPYSAVLKDNNFQIEWNGNVKDHQELIDLKNEYMQRQQSRAYQNKWNSYSRPNNSFDSILQQFESDILELEKPYGVENEFIPRNKVKSAKIQPEIPKPASPLKQSAAKNKPSNKTVNKQENKPNYSNYQSDSVENSYSFSNVNQKKFFDADSLFDSAVNEAISENELIDKQHLEEEGKKQEQKTPKVQVSPQTEEDNEPYIQNEKHIKNFKSDDDLVKYTGVDDIDIDDFDF
ncbi:transcription termination/antitermination protein NusA [Mesomycoplasma ovipneumoniae]|uniref:Transcription termination/antitermination protein NusA n=1 Tax=Mesomycoplasma ovipneumoniae TaxID=29562 RepID=A0AAJ2P6P8_9BACT|nr:transcription termination/antitermination protein NusA [Mesomycoplasma ovipneumoniae]MDW2834720.1 transcription termination/antitermination protein NusA [Mesomycoplasma ovipneumoniae]MDW2891156.1 transcription termination/antitermination protein NusA [Mesomycoplasma ovipneumoniae]MDW2892855.1 transcription termination/antitermination protein NusA [Mesomycoplasma ovipneumoniae]MDW2897788.1 transcription termination/antitermination protein NusA [Mesomycoplasma ovipneumoniae]MDW2908685.1 trans